MAHTEPSNNIILELRNITQRFGGVVALDNVSFDLQRGEIHSIVGENGAGKSTLIKILSGVHTQYEGEMHFHGSPVRFHSPADAKAKGIGTIYQELSIVPSLSVAENLFLGRQPVSKLGIVNWRQMYREAKTYLAELGVQLDVKRPMGSYALGEQQMVEVARVLFSGADVIILDEPTSALSPPEAERLFEFMARLKAQNKTMIFITHFLEDVMRVSDRITVLKNGQHVTTVPKSEASKSFLIQQMIGGEAETLMASYTIQSDAHAADSHGEVVFETNRLSKSRQFSGVNLSVRAGEVLGVYGFMVAGKTALANCLFGYEQPDAGEIKLQGKPVRIKSSTVARKMGIAYVPNDRKLSIFPGKEVYKNITITYLDRILGQILSKPKEVQVAEEKIKQVGVYPPDPMIDIAHLSGGNQQKAILAKWLVKTPQVLILNEPTRGMDVGAKDDVLQLVRQFKQQGMAIVLISSEPEIVLGNSDRIVVMSKGQVTQTVDNVDLTKEQLMQWA